MLNAVQHTEHLWIRSCDALLAPGEERAGVDIEIAGGVIASITPAAEPKEMAGEVLDGSGLLAIPGLANAHSHSPENCLRGIGEATPLEPWLLRMFGSSGLYSPDDHYACALAGAVEMLELGVTSVVDHLWMTPPAVDAVDAVMRAYSDAGIRAAVAPLMDDHDYTEDYARDLGTALELAGMSKHVVFLPADELIAQLKDCIGRWHGAEGGRLRVLAGPGGVQWASEELLGGLAELARANGTGIHIHLLETSLQETVCRHRFGVSAVAALARLGVLGPDCSLPHSVWIDSEAIGLIADSGAIPVHNPAANLRLGSGRAPIPELRAAGATVALGTDGSASSDNQNLWEAVRLAALKHNSAQSDRWLTGSEALTMATAGGAAVVGLGDRLGRIAEGALADIALVDRAGDGLAGSVETTAALALSESGRGVRHVIADGRIVVRDGACTAVDGSAARAALAEQASRRLKTANSPPPETEGAIAEMKRFRASVARETQQQEERT